MGRWCCALVAASLVFLLVDPGEMRAGWRLNLPPWETPAPVQEDIRLSMAELSARDRRVLDQQLHRLEKNIKRLQRVIDDYQRQQQRAP
jgi:hypothetical protein